ncbi:hypothetical protein L1987_70954 [Smallanthus sonchifolius]|uniref:Uncharacterized protein n=1 Tax=Smallanthus sonchifolius TaxID=185202 RepID=A0ACB9ASP5_9ASTR|nr:hypothetical protein L1987_70954 [Smallanthus sonchifolius]
MMQGQSSKVKKTPVSSNFQFQTPKVHGKYGLLDLPLPEMGLNQDDDLVPWLNYPLDDYGSNLLPELSGVTVHEPSMHNGQSNTSKVSRSGHLSLSSDPTVRSGVSEIGNSNCRSKAHNISHRDPVVQKQDSVLNFSHFSRPAVTKATVRNHGPQKEVGQPSMDSVKVCLNPVQWNSAEQASNDLTKSCKRKFRDEDFECQSQDVEEELLATKTAAASRGGTGSKRSRAAEVHNLSERVSKFSYPC